MREKGYTYLLDLFFLLLVTTIGVSRISARPGIPANMNPRTLTANDKILRDSAFFSQYSFIKILDEFEQPKVSDDEFYAQSTKVIFVVAKTDLNMKSSVIRELLEKIIPKLNEDSLQLEYMLVRGAASPEGPYKFNVWLGEHRCARLFDFINAHMRFPAQKGHYSTSSVPEDYDGLVRMMHSANDPLTDEIESIVKKYSEKGDYATLKKTLMSMDKGRTWKYLLKTYFPELRSAKVMFFFKKHHDADEKVSLQRCQGIKIPVELEIGRLSTRVPRIYPKLPVKEVKIEEPRLIRRHIIALRSNLLYDFFYMPGYYWAPSPNIQMEYYPLDGHITANIGFTGPYWHMWNSYQFWQIRDYNVEGRYYFKGHGDFTGLYASAYVHVNKYGIGLSKEKGWEGEGFGGGVMGGYVKTIKKLPRWRIEFSLGLGYYQTRYDPYVYGNPFNRFEDGLYYYKYYGKKADFKKRNHRYTWVGPTNVGIHITYDLLFRRIQKKGVSFNRSEKVIKEKGGRP